MADRAQYYRLNAICRFCGTPITSSEENPHAPYCSEYCLTLSIKLEGDYVSVRDRHSSLTNILFMIEDARHIIRKYTLKAARGDEDAHKVVSDYISIKRLNKARARRVNAMEAVHKPQQENPESPADDESQRPGDMSAFSEGWGVPCYRKHYSRENFSTGAIENFI